MQQQTLAQSFSYSGKGLHSGVQVTATLLPAPERTGIVFKRADIQGEEGHIALTPHGVHHTQLCSVIENDKGVSVATVEHLLAACYGMGLDNCIVEINGPEIPILDGSALPWAQGISEAGLTQQNATCAALIITKPITVNYEGRVLQALPDDRPGLRVEVMIDFPHPAIGRQEWAGKITPEKFISDIAPARTFCLERDIEAMQKAGMIKGGGLENAVVFGRDGTPINPEGLRFTDEPVRHKVLDMLGDFFMSGKRIQGKLIIPMPGHGANNALLRAIVA